MIILGHDDELADEVTTSGTEQDWGLALLFSVEPSDRALSCHGLAGSMGNYLRRLADNDVPVPR